MRPNLDAERSLSPYGRALLFPRESCGGAPSQFKRPLLWSAIEVLAFGARPALAKFLLHRKAHKAEADGEPINLVGPGANGTEYVVRAKPIIGVPKHGQDLVLDQLAASWVRWRADVPASQP